MKPFLFLFGLIISAEISVIKSECRFKYDNGSKIEKTRQNCFCGPKKKSFEYDKNDKKYCCVPSTSTCDESETNTKWCPDGHLLPKYQACNGFCWSSNQRNCPQINMASFTSEQCYTKGWTAEDEYSVILI